MNTLRKALYAALVTAITTITMVFGLIAPASAAAGSIHNVASSTYVATYKKTNGQLGYIWPNVISQDDVVSIYVPSTKMYKIRKAGSTTWRYYCGSGWVTASLPGTSGRVSVEVLGGVCA